MAMDRKLFEGLDVLTRGVDGSIDLVVKGWALGWRTIVSKSVANMRSPFEGARLIDGARLPEKSKSDLLAEMTAQAGSLSTIITKTR